MNRHVAFSAAAGDRVATLGEFLRQCQSRDRDARLLIVMMLANILETDRDRSEAHVMHDDTSRRALSALRRIFLALLLGAIASGFLATRVNRADEESKADEPSVADAAAVPADDKKSENDGNPTFQLGSGLAWLANHQNSDGSWSFNWTLGDRCRLFPNPGNNKSKIAATGLALLPFLEGGHTHQKKRRYRDVVRKGILYLVSHIDPKTGRLYERDGDEDWHMMGHGIAAYALAEAYGNTRDKQLQAPAQLAINYIVKAQGEDGGWRSAPNKPGNTSVLGWQILTLRSAKMSYLNVPDDVFPRAMKFLDSVQEADGTKYRATKKSDADPTPALSATGLLSRISMGWPEDHPTVQAGMKAIVEQGPHPTDVEYNFFASEFVWTSDHDRNILGPTARKWAAALRDQLVKSQVKKGGAPLVGSWYFNRDGNSYVTSDGGQREANSGGRLYDTAMATLALQAAYRRW